MSKLEKEGAFLMCIHSLIRSLIHSFVHSFIYNFDFKNSVSQNYVQ